MTMAQFFLTHHYCVAHGVDTFVNGTPHSPMAMYPLLYVLMQSASSKTATHEHDLESKYWMTTDLPSQ